MTVGEIIDPEGLPVANHKVWASIKVQDQRKFGTHYPTTFTQRVETTTDAQGRYQLTNLPCKTELMLGTNTLDHQPNSFRLIDEAYFLPEDATRDKLWSGF